MTISRKPLSMVVNGQSIKPVDVPADMMLIDFLAEYLNLTGTRLGCGQGICGACAVLVENPDGSLAEHRACITGAHWFSGKRVRTIEGHASRNDKGEVTALTPVQKAFVENYAFQCGYCTPGFVAAATAFLDKLKRQPVDKDRLEDAIVEALDGHICRCTGYVRYYQAVRTVALATPGLVRQ